MNHTTVLLQESVSLLDIHNGDTVVDATLGAGGHSELVLLNNPNITLIGIDLDSYALTSAKERLSKVVTKTSPKFVQGNFANIPNILESIECKKVNKFIFDFGVSSYQIDDSGRGFSFLRDEPLSMTLSDDPKFAPINAYTVVNEWSEETLSDIIHGFGEDRFARKIAKAIVEHRENSPIKTSMELAEVVANAIPKRFWPKRIHPATRTFQAVRIAVNGELDVIEKGLRGAWSMLSNGGRISAISFHSLEDRIVKRFMRSKADEGEGILITKKPIVPSDKEMVENPRSRSAKLRVIEKIV